MNNDDFRGRARLKFSKNFQMPKSKKNMQTSAARAAKKSKLSISREIPGPLNDTRVSEEGPLSYDLGYESYDEYKSNDDSSSGSDSDYYSDHESSENEYQELIEIEAPANQSKTKGKTESESLRQKFIREEKLNNSLTQVRF